MELTRIIESKYYENLVSAIYAEEKNNSIKIEVLNQVKALVKQGNNVYRVEDAITNTLVGIEVGKEQNIVFSKFRKIIT